MTKLIVTIANRITLLKFNPDDESYLSKVQRYFVIWIYH